MYSRGARGADIIPTGQIFIKIKSQRAPLSRTYQALSAFYLVCYRYLCKLSALNWNILRSQCTFFSWSMVVKKNYRCPYTTKAVIHNIDKQRFKMWMHYFFNQPRCLVNHKHLKQKYTSSPGIIYLVPTLYFFFMRRDSVKIWLRIIPTGE